LDPNSFWLNKGNRGRRALFGRTRKLVCTKQHQAFPGLSRSGVGEIQPEGGGCDRVGGKSLKGGGCCVTSGEKGVPGEKHLEREEGGFPTPRDRQRTGEINSLKGGKLKLGIGKKKKVIFCLL